MSFSPDNLTWSTPETYAASKIYTLPAGDGAKTIYVKYYDKAGNASVVYSKAITLDTIAPTGSIDINSGADYTTSVNVILSLSGTDVGSGLDKMILSDGRVTAAVFLPEDYFPTKPFTLIPDDGLKTVYVTYYDKAGNASQSYSKQIILDTIAPQVILTSAALTKNSAYTLTYTVDGTAQIESITLQEGSNVIARTFQDQAGNQTQVNWTVTLDTVPPNIVFNSASLTNNLNYTLVYTVDGAQKSKALTLATEGTNTLSVTETDLAGNSSTKTYAVTLDTIAPNIVFTSLQLINNASYSLTYTVDVVPAQESRTLVEGQNSLSVTKTDLAGNSSTKPYLVTLDTKAPVVSNMAANNLTSTSVTITWTTNEASDSQVQYRVQGTTTWTNTMLNTSLVTSHSIALSGLNASTVYEYWVKSKDAAGNLATQATLSTLTTLAPPDTTPPTISAVTSSSVTSTGATIAWTTRS